MLGSSSPALRSQVCTTPRLSSPVFWGWNPYPQAHEASSLLTEPSLQIPWFISVELLVPGRLGALALAQDPGVWEGALPTPVLLLGTGYHCTFLLGLAGVGGEEARHSRGGWYMALGPFSLAEARLGEHRGETALKAGCTFLGSRHTHPQ